MTDSTPTEGSCTTRITELLHCRQQLDAELAELCGAEYTQCEECAKRTREDAEEEELQHDLQVHQTELQAQNEELRRIQEQLTAARDSYSDLYDFAPVGYLTLNAEGRLVQVNFTFANLLGGIDRAHLLQQPLSGFIARESQDDFHFFWHRLQQSKELEAVELRLIKADGTAFWARLDAIVAQQKSSGIAREAREYSLTVSDIAERKRIEEVLRESEERFRTLADTFTLPVVE